MPRTPFVRSLLAPSQWLVWLGIGVIWLIGRLPRPLLMGLGRMLGLLVSIIPAQRRHIAQVNIALCFPELSKAEQKALLHANLRDVGLMEVEFAFGWMGSERAFNRVPVTFEGLEHLHATREQGRGVLLVGGHFAHLEVCARLTSISQGINVGAMYRKMDSPAFDWAVLRARQRYSPRLFQKNDIRGAVKYLRRGGIVWYAPDQDMRGKDSVFVPFFGVQASTITATHHLARLSGAVVVPFFHRRLPGNAGYAIRLATPLENFPSDDPVRDTARISACIETMVRAAPEQYMWVHKRFKTRPPGEPSVY